MSKTTEDRETPPPRLKPKELRARNNKIIEAKKTAAKRALKKATATIKSSKRVNVAGKITRPKPLMSVRTAAPPPRRPRSNADKDRRKTRNVSETGSGRTKRGWRKLYVGDLREDITQKELEEEFEKFGELFDVWLARNPPGFGFVDFKESSDATRAVRTLDGAYVLGSRIKVQFAKALNPRAAAMVALVRRRGKFLQGPASGGSYRRDKRVVPRFEVRGRGRGIRGRRMRYSPVDVIPEPWSSRRSLSPYNRLRGSLHRSPSPPPFRRGYAPPPLPPLPPMYDPFDPRFREMALMGGWRRGRSPPMPPPGPPLPRFRSRSPSPPPRFGSRSGSRRYSITSPG